MDIPNNILKHMFRNMYFVNGTAYAGKSTMVRLLAERYGGICCGENYHDVLMGAIDRVHQPNLSYFDTMRDWQEFVNRPPDEYDRWIAGCSEEAAGLEIIRLLQLTERETPVFVDTNLSAEMLREISDYHHTAVLLAPQSTSVERFFDRNDPEKQFILQQIQASSNPEQTMANYRKCLERTNSPEKYRAWEASGLFTLVRDDARTPEETLGILAEHFQLQGGEG